MIKNINKLITFYTVAKEKSFTKAASTLNQKQSLISRQISTLEQELGSKLFIRHYRGVELTEYGEEIFKISKKLIDELKKISPLKENKREDRSVSILTTTGASHFILLGKMKAFKQKYPDTPIKIICVDDEVDVEEHYADVFILPKQKINKTFYQKRAFQVELGIYASVDYLKKMGAPKTPQDLDDHLLISYHHDSTLHAGKLDWHLYADAQDNTVRRPSISVNSVISQFMLAEDGLGIAPLATHFPLLKGSKLVRVLPDYNKAATGDIYFITKKTNFDDEKIQYLYELLEESEKL